MRLHVFAAIVLELQMAGLKDAGILLEEKPVFLYMSVTGLTVRHVGESSSSMQILPYPSEPSSILVIYLTQRDQILPPGAWCTIF